jgi:hypothetical protein
MWKLARRPTALLAIDPKDLRAALVDQRATMERDDEGDAGPGRPASEFQVLLHRAGDCDARLPPRRKPALEIFALTRRTA